MQIRDNLAQDYADIYTPEVLAALAFMAGFNDEQQRLMAERIERRNAGCIRQLWHQWYPERSTMKDHKNIQLEQKIL